MCCGSRGNIAANQTLLFNQEVTLYLSFISLLYTAYPQLLVLFSKSAYSIFNYHKKHTTQHMLSQILRRRSVQSIFFEPMELYFTRCNLKIHIKPAPSLKYQLIKLIKSKLLSISPFGSLLVNVRVPLLFM